MAGSGASGRRAEDLHESRDVEDLLDLRIGADQVDAAAVLAHALEAADQHAESGRVDVADLLEVDDEVVVALIDQLADRVLDLRRGVDVDLARQLDDVRFVARLVHLDFDIQRFLLLFRFRPELGFEFVAAALRGGLPFGDRTFERLANALERVCGCVAREVRRLARLGAQHVARLFSRPRCEQQRHDGARRRSRQKPRPERCLRAAFGH